MKHTKEPWDHMAGMPTNVLGASGLRVARCDFDGDFNHPEAHENARRIVACVNACAGIPTENLEKYLGNAIVNGNTLILEDRLSNSERRCYKILELLEAMYDSFVGYVEGGKEDELMQQVAAAIASAKGGA